MEDGDGDAFPVQGFEQILQGWPVKLQFHPDRGRFLTATRRIVPGEVILRERAWAFGSSPVHKAHICHACLTFSSVPLKLACPKCSQVYFCSKHCWQSAHLGKWTHSAIQRAEIRLCVDSSLVVGKIKGQKDHNNKLHHREECDALLRLHRSRTIRDFDDDEIEQMRLAIQILVNRFYELKTNTEEMECSDAEKDGKQEEQINVKVFPPNLSLVDSTVCVSSLILTKKRKNIIFALNLYLSISTGVFFVLMSRIVQLEGQKK